MNIVFFTHPLFITSQSMPRYAKFLGESMRKRGHDVTYITAQPFFFNIPVPGFLKKWLGYIDQYIVFPLVAKRKIKKYNKETLFVFTDQALGPWVPLVKNRPHVIHCHDFLAQRSALGEIVENRTEWTGRLYQAYIRRGYRQGKNFISITHKTQQDLHSFLGRKPLLSEIVYNTLTRDYTAVDVVDARCWIQEKTGLNLVDGYILHVGGNQWYKNRMGVIEIYNAWRNISSISVPLIMIGRAPSEEMRVKTQGAEYEKDIHWINDADDTFVNYAYRGASVFLFPSIAEGFGLPILEAMANNCLVVTTGEEPMTEAGGDAAFYIEKYSKEKVVSWANSSAKKLDEVMNLSEVEKGKLLELIKEQVALFKTELVHDKLEDIYRRVLNISNK